MGFNIAAALIEGASREQVLKRLGLMGEPTVESTVMEATTREYEYSHVFLGEYRGFSLVLGFGAVTEWCDVWPELSRDHRVLWFTLSENVAGVNSFTLCEQGAEVRAYLEDGDEWSGEPLPIEAEMNKAEDHPADMVDRVFRDFAGGDGYAGDAFLDVPVSGWEFEVDDLDD